MPDMMAGQNDDLPLISEMAFSDLGLPDGRLVSSYLGSF
jgi:hypothetical protein